MTEAEPRAGHPQGWVQLALLTVALLTGALRWQHAVLEGYTKPDETVYVRAAELWSAGRSPYEEGGYFYTPAFAWAAAQLTELTSSLTYLQIQRTFNLLGICVATWLSVVIARWRTWPALLVTVLWICLSPGAALSIEIGNATGVPTALTLAGLWAWRWRPDLAGLSLGVAQVAKPIAPFAALCLVARKGSDRGRSLLAGFVSVAVSALLLLVGWRYLGDLVGNASGSVSPYNFSLQRVLGGLGLRLEPIWISAILAGAGLWWIARHRLSTSELLVVALTLNLLAAPILWAHSLLLFLPVQLLAAERMARSLLALRALPVAARSRAALPSVVAGLALAATVFSEAGAGAMTESSPLQSVVLAVPYLSVLYLGVYAFRGLSGRNGPRQPRPSQPG